MGKGKAEGAAMGVGACCGLLHLGLSIFIIVYGLQEYGTQYEPIGSCSEDNTQKWIEEKVLPTPWVQEWIAEQPPGVDTPEGFNIAKNWKDLKEFLKYMASSGQVELCMAKCAGDFSVPVLIFSIAFILELVIVVCAAGLLATKGADAGGGAMLFILPLLCVIICLMIASSIATTVVSAQSGCWSWYIQGPCKDPDIMPSATTGNGTYIGNETWCPAQWWHYQKYTYILIPYYFVLVCCFQVMNLAKKE